MRSVLRPLLAASAVAAPALAASVLAASVLAPARLAAQSPERYTLRGSAVEIHQVVGRVTVVQGSGAEVTVDVTRRGRDAGRVRVERDGDRGLRIGARDEDLVYPELRGSRVSGRVARDGTIGGDGWMGGRTVTIRRDGSGTEAWADVVVRVPRGQQVAVHVLAGWGEAKDVEADVTLDTHAARAVAERTRGRLVVDAGSGGADVRDAQGDVTIDSGSGDVVLSGVNARRLVVDAGSGDVRGEGVRAPDLSLDTGSGDVRLARVEARTIRLDSGSGDVDLDLAADVDDVRIDSGSGSVTLRVPTTLGAEVDVDMGSGGFDTQLPIRVSRSERRHITGTVGDGRGRIVIDSGSGKVRMVAR